MRLNEITRELDPEKLERIIAANCKQALDSPIILYRGVNNKPNMFISDIRDDRKARDSRPLSVTIFNYCMETWGFPFRKENALSTSNMYSQADTYSSMIYQVYPFDGAEYLCNNRFFDLMSFTRGIIREFITDSKKELLRNIPYVAKDVEMKYNVHLIGGGNFNNFEFADINFIGWLNSNLDKYRVNFIYSKDINDMKSAEGEILVFGAKYVAKLTT